MIKKSMGIVVTLGILSAIAMGAYLLSGGGASPAKEVEVADTDTTPPVTATAPVASVAESAAGPSTGRVMVEVQGAVTSPGVYSFLSDARVFDALQKAGGPLESAETRDVNIAAVLLDGSVLSVPYQSRGQGSIQPGAADLNPPTYTRSGWSDGARQSRATASVGAADSQTSSKININTATQAELETLPGVGVKTAEKIISFRQTQPFTQVDDLRYVQGIGEKRMETLRPYVAVD